MRRPRPSLLRPIGGLPAAALAAVGLVVLLVGCGAADPAFRSGRRAGLVAGHRGATSAERAEGARLAHRFARDYARGAYHRRPPPIDGLSPAVRRALVAAASRVPAARRGLRPRLLALYLSQRADGALMATMRIGDGRFPPFTVGFVVVHRGGQPRIASISLPD